MGQEGMALALLSMGMVPLEGEDEEYKNEDYEKMHKEIYDEEGNPKNPKGEILDDYVEALGNPIFDPELAPPVLRHLLKM